MQWPELATLQFPAKKTFQNTSRSVLESRKRVLNSYLQSLTSISRDPRYMALLSSQYLGGFLSPEIQTERHGNSVRHTCDVSFVIVPITDWIWC